MAPLTSHLRFFSWPRCPHPLPTLPTATFSPSCRAAQKTVKDIEALGSSITDVQGEVKNVNSRVDDADMKLAARFEEMTSKLGGQRKQFDDLQAALVETRSSISENPDIFAAINKAVERLDAELGKANEDRAADREDDGRALQENRRC